MHGGRAPQRLAAATARARGTLGSPGPSYERNKSCALRVKILLKKIFPDVGPIYLVSLKVPESDGLCRAGRSRLFPHLRFAEETGGFKAL